MIVTLIAAADRNRVIGKDGKLPWNIPEDLEHFRRVTMGYPVVMGRKTWESLPKKLQGRVNVVITRQPDYKVDSPGVLVVRSLEAALENCRFYRRVFVIGGGEIYKQAMPKADRILLTEVQTEVEGGDAWFPQIDPMWWVELQRLRRTSPSQGYVFDFVTYERLKH